METTGMMYTRLGRLASLQQRSSSKQHTYSTCSEGQPACNKGHRVHIVLYYTKRLNTQRAGPTRPLPGLAGADLIFQWIGLIEYIPCYSAPAVHWGPLSATRLASRKILIGQNIKKRTGPALGVLCGTIHTHTGIGQLARANIQRQFANFVCENAWAMP